MKSAYRIYAAIVVALIFSVGAFAGTWSWSFENRKVGTGEIPIRTACMMPARGTLSKLGMKGGEGMSTESEEWTTQLQNIVESHLKLAGIELVSAVSNSDGGASDAELNQLLVRLRGRYDAIDDQMQRKPKDVAQSRFTLGDEVALLPCNAHADVLVFIQGAGTVLTGGKKAMGLLGVGARDSEAILFVAMADAKTGEIVGLVKILNDETFVNNSDKAYGKHLDKQFRKMKIGSNVGSKKKEEEKE